jgi:hypothetical protein
MEQYYVEGEGIVSQEMSEIDISAPSLKCSSRLGSNRPERKVSGVSIRTLAPSVGDSLPTYDRGLSVKAHWRHPRQMGPSVVMVLSVEHR